MSHPRQRALPVFAFVTTVVLSALSAFAVGPACAAETAYPGFGIGIGASVQSRPYKDIDDQTNALHGKHFLANERWQQCHHQKHEIQRHSCL